MERIEESLDQIMIEFRSNGRDVDYVELDLDGIELERYAPDARSLIIGLLQGSGLDAEMKIIRPPSKTPYYLPTSAFNVIEKLPMAGVPPGYSTWNPHFVQHVPLQESRPSPASCVVDLTQSMSQMALSDRGANIFITSTNQQISRPIFGSGSTMKPGFAELRQTQFWKWDCHAPNTVDPGRSPLHISMNPGDPVETLVETPVETPVVAMVTKSCSDNDVSSEEDLSICAESEDSGNFTGGELSPNSDHSPTLTSEAESEAPSYASVVNTCTQATIHYDGVSEPMQTSCVPVAVPPQTPKSHHLEGLKAHSWIQKKFRRLSESLSDDGHRFKECVFCKTNGETPSLYRGHVLKDEQGRTVCHVLQKYVCPLCGATGVNAHTLKYCPQNSNPPAVSMMTTLKSMRSATGNLRMMANSRRTRSTARRVFKKSSSFTAA